jgi:hypothetical protein
VNTVTENAAKAAGVSTDLKKYVKSLRCCTQNQVRAALKRAALKKKKK